MKKLLSTVMLLAMSVQVFSQTPQTIVTTERTLMRRNNPSPQDYTPYYKFRVYFTDKKQSEFSIRHPEKFLSQKAIERRKKQGIKIDQTDLPVCSSYLNQIGNKGVKILHTSKWNNTAVVSCTDTTVMDAIRQLPFIASVRKVAQYTRPQSRMGGNRKNNLRQAIETDLGTSYGNTAYSQISQLNGIALHGAGFKGAGMTVAIIDGGFLNADVIPGFANTKILGTKDFVDPSEEFYATQSHGMMVLSCMGANITGWQIGTAPEAAYWLIRSEESATEQLVEEDNWAAAIEFADSVGADVVNTSLGYYDFDNKADNLGHESLDGHTHICSNSASMVASKGMILCCSAGNEGNGKWKKISAPADAEDILTVGAVSDNGQRAPFTSEGYSADGRVKPDVMAIGVFSGVYGTNGSLTSSHGTSFASPILCGMVTCLWQALPHLNAYQVMDIIRRSGDRFTNPDPVYGYGIPDFFHAYTLGLVYPANQ